ncbi:MAG: SDR family oxidoreductase [Hyphomonadaceae bacterium]|nr:SDR family oxidoreductase [Hyphomonadaceae bacterium]
MRGLNGKAGLVAGGARGIGAATARRLAEEGAMVAIGDIRFELAQETAASIVAAGGRAIAVELDGTKPDSAAAAVAATLAAFDRLDFVHSNLAGGTEGDHDALDCPLDVFDKSVAVNLRSHLILTQAALPAMLKRGGGAMVYTSSGAATGGNPFQPAYAMTKNGVHALARHVATRYGRQGVRSNVIAPGLILTEAVKQHLTEADVEKGRKRTPHTRFGEPKDIAALVAFLVSDDGEFINGQVLYVNGGLQLRD